MDILDVRELCLSLPQSEETTPFDETTLVYKVAGKMFLLADMTDGRAVNVKCDPDHAIALRERYAEVTPGWHMNKRHWNTVRIDGDLPEKLIREWVVDSYRLVAGSLPKTVRGPLLEALDACAEENEPEKPMNPNRRKNCFCLRSLCWRPRQPAPRSTSKATAKATSPPAGPKDDGTRGGSPSPENR